MLLRRLALFIVATPPAFTLLGVLLYLIRTSDADAAAWRGLCAFVASGAILRFVTLDPATPAVATQSTSYQLRSWLTYTTIGGVTVSAGYSATMGGGRESPGGSPNGFRNEEQQARFEVQQFVAKGWQLGRAIKA